MDRKNRVNNLINQALSSAEVDSTDFILESTYRNNAYKDPHPKRLEQVRKKLEFLEQDDLMDDIVYHGPSGDSLELVAADLKNALTNTEEPADPVNTEVELSIPERTTVEYTRLTTPEQKTESSNQNALMDDIVNYGPSGISLELVAADLENAFTNTEGPSNPVNTEVELSIPERTTVEYTRLTTPEQKTQSSTHVSANSTNSTIVGYSQPGCSTTKRCRKRKAKTNKKYLDYLSDEDFSTFINCDNALDSDYWEESSSSSNKEEVISKSDKRKKSKKARKTKSKEQNPSLDDKDEEIVGEKGLKKKRINLRKDRSVKRSTGKEYERKNGKKVPAKSVQPNPCLGKKCVNGCENIESEKRQKVFDHFWGLPENRRKDWLVSITQKEKIKRKRVESEKRSTTFYYHINEGEGRRRVCLQFLSATLNISSKTIYHTAKNADWGCARDDLRGKHVPANKTKSDTIKGAFDFIKSLPAVPAHYCRHDSNKVYLGSEYKNLACVYTAYKQKSMNDGIDYVSERVFRKIFNEDFNIGFHQPKKDKCLKCLKFEQTDMTDPVKAKEKADHEIEKDESYNRFFTHKNIYKSDPKTLCVSFDLEKVLNTPHGDSMLLYYSRKLAVYNLCFYENGTRRVFCYYWDESHGKRGANEICSILHKYILSVDERATVRNLLLYCDCCPGQNRNRVVLAMIHSTLHMCKNLETIQINYLLTGHTYMPVDSVHAVIEGNLKKTIIYAPSQWYTVFSTARKDPFPYVVENLTFEDFYKWDSVAEKYFKGNLTGKISKIRIATFKKSNLSNISVKISMNKFAKSSVVEIQSKARVPLMSCYRSRLPISKPKYDDLNKLCKEKVIPAQFQREYTEIQSSSSTKDALPETDIEDADPDDF